MKQFLWASIFVIFSAQSFADAKSVGTVILSFGQNVAVSSGGDQRQLKRQSDIYAEDLLITSSKGRLQVRFTDGSRLSLKPDTEFKIAEYQFEDAKPDDGKAIYKLLKGGMRTISGQIGKVDKEDYQLDAVVATIGIRGTDFSVDKMGEMVTGSVSNGRINVAAKQGGNRDVAKGKSFSLQGPKGAVNVFKTPAVEQGSSENNETSEEEGTEEESPEEESTEADDGAETEATESETAEGEASEDTQSGTNGTSDSSSTTSTEGDSASTDSSLSLDTAATTTGDGTSTGEIPASSPTSEGSQNVVIVSPDPTGKGSAAPAGSIAAVAFTENDPDKGIRASSGRIEVNGQSALTVDGSSGTGDLLTGLLYIDQSNNSSEDCTPCTMSGPSNSGNVLNNSNKTVGGAKVTWGRWAAGDYTVIENGTQSNTVGSFHFMFADVHTEASVITNKTGDFVYRLGSAVGAYTSPEIETGATGTLETFVGDGGTGGHLYEGTYFRVDFDRQQLLEVGIEANVAGGSYVLREDPSANLSLSNVLNGNDVKISGTCTGGSCSGGTTDLSGRMSIDFVGAGAEGAVTSYGASGTNASTGTTATITGTILLEGTASP